MIKGYGAANEIICGKSFGSEREKETEEFKMNLLVHSPICIDKVSSSLIYGFRNFGTHALVTAVAAYMNTSMELPYVRVHLRPFEYSWLVMLVLVYCTGLRILTILIHSVKDI